MDDLDRFLMQGQMEEIKRRRNPEEYARGLEQIKGAAMGVRLLGGSYAEALAAVREARNDPGLTEHLRSKDD